MLRFFKNGKTLHFNIARFLGGFNCNSILPNSNMNRFPDIFHIVKRPQCCKKADNLKDNSSSSKCPVTNSLEPPRFPEFCCGNNCKHCVWDIYFEELKAYNEKNNQLTNSSESEDFSTKAFLEFENKLKRNKSDKENPVKDRENSD